MKVILCLLLMTIVSAECRVIMIDFEKSSRDVKKLPRFWTNTGFSPTEPIRNVSSFFESKDLNMNLEIIGSLPNNGLKNVRIHWMLNLIDIVGYDSFSNPILNFKNLDDFLRKLTEEYNLMPTIEFMITLKFKELKREVWKNFAYQIVSRYAEKYGIKAVSKWKFESWNEPDLDLYNVLNFTLYDYLEYMHRIKEGLLAVKQKFSSNKKLKFRGPAGLFKDHKKHIFCWSLLEKCNVNITNCPIDIITFHRKGNGNEANEIIDGSFELIDEFSQKFKNLSTLPYSNTEADPIKKWSEPRDFHADTRYASILVETIFQHWQAKFDKRLSNLESISHDNSFMNFHPNIFTQRTLLARFQMNNSVPKYSQLIQKPVFSALGLISNLGSHASNFQKSQNVSFIVSKSYGKAFYACIIILTHVNTINFINQTKVIEINIKNLPQRDDLNYFVEYIDNKRTNPSMIFENFAKPTFPSVKMLDEMKNSQNPRILEQPNRVIDRKIFLNAQLLEPFIISVRIFSKNVRKPKKPFNLRLRRINLQDIVLFWSDSFYKMRCIKTYEIFFKYQDEYLQIDTGKHIPFLYHQLRHTIPGCFKVRSLDINHRHSEFSNEICFNS